eukprot:PhF_6_TR40399/c3_g1_i1/m.60194
MNFSMLSWVVVCTMVLSCIGQTIRAPKVKWSQSADKITMTLVGTKCSLNNQKTQEYKYSIKEDDKFSFQCESATGGQVGLNLTFREDVVSTLSNCVSEYPKHEDIKCTLRKKHQHSFDRLVDDLGPYRDIISRDKSAPENKGAASAPEQGEKEEYWKNHDLLRNIHTQADYIQMLKQDYTLVDVSYPWCSQCGESKQRFLDLINKINQHQHELNHTMNFAYIDARHHRSARKYFNPSCDASCDFFVVRSGERPFRIPYQYEIERMMAKVFNYDKEKVYVLTAKDIPEYTTVHHIAVLGVFPNRQDYRFEVFNRIVNLVRGRNVAIGFLLDPNVTVARFEIYRQFEDHLNYTGTWEVEPIMRYLNHSVVPTLQTYEYDLRDDADATGKPHVIFFSPNGEPRLIFDEIIRKFKGRMNFFYVNTSGGNYGNMMEEYGFGHEDTVNPHIGVCSKFTQADAPKYGFIDGHITEDNKAHVIAWLDRAVSKSLNRTYKSAKRPGEFYVGDLNTVVGRTVEEYRNETEFHTVLFLYKFHQDFTEEIRNELRKFARSLKKQELDKLFVASMETTRNTFNRKLLCDIEEDHANPLMVLIGKGQCIKYDMRRNDEANVIQLLYFLRKHVPYVEENWEKVQTEIDFLKAAKEKELKDMEQRKQEFEDKLDEYEKVKLAKGVIKYIKVRGEPGGTSPYDGSDVTAHFALYLHSTLKRIESSYTNGQVFRFRMGGGGVVKCFDEAFASMTVGEKAVLFCPSDMAYNTYGTDRIPPNADLYYEVHLIHFDEPPPKTEL